MAARAIALLALALSTGAATNSVRKTDSAVVVAEPAGGSAGFICLWAIYATLAEVGKSCRAAHDVPVDAALERSASRLEDYARRHSPAGAALMARYRASRIEGATRACNSDALQMYEHLAQAGPEAIRRQTESLLASSPPVEWGDCL